MMAISCQVMDVILNVGLSQVGLAQTLINSFQLAHQNVEMARESVTSLSQLTAMMVIQITMMDAVVLARSNYIGLAMEYLQSVLTLAEMELSINMPGSNATMGKRWRLMEKL